MTLSNFFGVVVCMCVLCIPTLLNANEDIDNQNISHEEMSKAGQAIAEKLCARCHAIDKTGDSPFKEAPPFRTFASKWPLESLEEALAEGIVVGHPDMPEFQFEPGQISAFLAYLESISEPAE